MLEAKSKDQGHKRKCSPKKRSSKIFSGVLQCKTFSKIFFQMIYKISTIQKECCRRAEDRAIFEDLRLQGQGQGLDLRGQGQGLQNVSSRTSSRPRTSLRTPPLDIRPRFHFNAKHCSWHFLYRFVTVISRYLRSHFLHSC